VYYKKVEGLITPFDLPVECFPDYEKILDEDPTCVGTVNIMLKGRVTASTASGYKSVVDRFRAFCLEKKYQFPKFTAETALRFVKEAFEKGARLSFFQKVVPALAMLEEVVGQTDSALSGTVCSAVTAFKRELALTRGIVKKATGYSYGIIRYLVQKEMLPGRASCGKYRPNIFVPSSEQ